MEDFDEEDVDMASSLAAVHDPTYGGTVPMTPPDEPEDTRTTEDILREQDEAVRGYFDSALTGESYSLIAADGRLAHRIQVCKACYALVRIVDRIPHGIFHQQLRAQLVF